MDFFKVNGKKIKAPTELTMSQEILDKAERTVDGTMVVDVIGTKRKVDVSWEYLSKEDMTTLAKEIGGDKFAEIAYHDNATGDLVTMTGRSGGLTYMPHYDWAKGKIMWKSVSLSFTER
ncbi:MAG: hypothetical protein NC311_11885 [Muribaculaceae bacterium]|nr:hypothetical protein [Muribaculaceae bacterium]